MAVSERLLIEEEYVKTHPESHRLFTEQLLVVPGGITHASRAFQPFPLFIRSMSGSRKWDADGHELVDYWMGHGANLLGHGQPVIMEAISRQLSAGLHAGGESELALRWATLIRELVPSAERVRFCASGGEATQMAIRVARAFTGRDRIVKFEYHFHGWHDAVAQGVIPPLEAAWSSGIPAAVAHQTVVLPCNDIGLVRSLLDRDGGVAAVILEPAGGHSDSIPVSPAFLQSLRELTVERSVLLIFDEVVTGFRYAPGGAQEYFGVTPDITALGKIVAGGLPAGAVVGRAEVMDTLAPRSSGEESRPYTPHPGTWNANPLAAAAGIAALTLIQDGQLIDAARIQADKLRHGLNGVFTRHGVQGLAYGRSSIWKTYLGEPPKLLTGDFTNSREDSALLRRGWGSLAVPMRQSMILEGIDMMHNGGFMSAVHSDADIERTVLGFDRSIKRLQAAKLI